MDRQPPVPSNALTEWTRHPVPVDVGQICHLADIEERAATRDLELIGEPSCCRRFSATDKYEASYRSRKTSRCVGPGL